MLNNFRQVPQVIEHQISSKEDFRSQLQLKQVMQKRAWNYFQPRNSGKPRDLLGHLIVVGKPSWPYEEKGGEAFVLKT